MATGKVGIIINARYVLDPSDIEKFRAITGRIVEAARQQPGFVFLSVSQDTQDPRTFILTEGWNSQEEFGKFFIDEEFQAVLSDAFKLKILDRSGTLFEISAQQDLQMPVPASL